MKSLLSVVRPALVVFTLICSVALAEKTWPGVLVIDDFENGLGKWENQDAGKLSLTDDAPQGKKALRWVAGDDGLGHIVFRGLSRDTIDFSQYDILMLRIRVSGKRVWNINPIIQQYPAIYGYRGLFWTVDTLYPYERWYTLSIDLTRWENAWPNTYDAKKQEFQFEIHQLAGAGKTCVEIDDVKLLKNPLGIKPSYHPTTVRGAKGGQTWRYPVTINNRSKKAYTVTIARDKEDPGKLAPMELVVPEKPFVIQPGKEKEVPLAIALPANLAKTTKPFTAGKARVAFRIKEIPGLILYTELSAGLPPRKWSHPAILCGPGRMQELQQAYKDEGARKTMNRFFLQTVKKGEKLITWQPQYPPTGARGLRGLKAAALSAEVKARLLKIRVPNLPCEVYQDPETGIAYFGPPYENGVKGHYSVHMANAGNARALGLAYLVSGRKEFATAAARIIKGYIPVYLKLPIVCAAQGSPVSSAASGSTRISGSFMHERVWLTNLAIALDCILPSGAIDAETLAKLRERVLVPSATNMMNHKVGVMNLQWMIQSASLYAGVAGEDASLLARAVHDRHGMAALMKIGFLKDGNWWENPSYQNVAKLAAFPAIGVCVHNGILPYTEALDRAVIASYTFYGPDGRSPTLGTGGAANHLSSDLGAFVFSSLSKDPRVHWLVQKRRPRPGFYGLGDAAMFRQTKSTMPAAKTVSPVPTKTVNLPDYGGVAMRLPGTDRYCYVHYGRELVHGHRNKLSFQAYGKGGWYARNVMGGYGNNFANFLETVASANTVIVDGKNADMDTGELLFLNSSKDAVCVSAREIGAYKTVEHERSVILTKGPLIVIDRIKADKPHRYDWLYHLCLTGLHVNQDKLVKQAASLGKTPFYESLKPLGSLPEGVIKLSRPAGKSKKRRSKAVGGGGLMARTPGGTMHALHIKDSLKPHDSLLWRQDGKTVSFAAAIWPYSNGEKGTVSIERLPVTANGKTVGIESGQAVRVTTPEGRWVVLVNYSGRALSCQGARGTERVIVKEGK